MTEENRLLGRLQPLPPNLTLITDRFWQRKEFSSLKIDSSDSKPMGVDDKEVLIPVIAKLLPLVEGKAGITLLTIPKGLSLNKLVRVAEKITGRYGKIFIAN